MNKFVYINDGVATLKISEFDLKGNFRRVIKTNKRCFHITSLSNNKLAYLSLKRTMKDQKVQIIIKDLKTERETCILRKTIPFKSYMIFNKGRYMISLGNHTGEFFIRSSKNKTLLVAYSGENKIYEYNNRGKLLKTITLPIKAVAVKAKYIKDMKNSYVKHYEKRKFSYLKELKAADFSKFVVENLPYYRDITIDDKGNIILLNWNSDYVDNSKKLRIYDSKGKFISNCLIDENAYETQFEHFCFTNKGIFCLAKKKDDEDAWPQIIKIK